MNGIADCHVHIVDPVRFPFQPGVGYTPRPHESGTRENLVAELDRHGVTHALLVQPSCYAFDNTALLDAVAAYPGRFKGIAVVSGAESDRRLEDLSAGGVVGIRFNLPSFDAHAFADPGVPRLLARAKALGWFVQVHGHDQQWAAAAPLLLESGVRVVVDHFGVTDASVGLSAPGIQAVLSLGRSGRAVVKISAPFRAANRGDGYAALCPYVEAILAAFGARGCLWGSDWPFLALGRDIDYRHAQQAFERWFATGADRDAVLRANPARLFGFGPPA